jgi:hypothetical protein
MIYVKIPESGSVLSAAVSRTLPNDEQLLLTVNDWHQCHSHH